jgi:IS30 family transposase
MAKKLTELIAEEELKRKQQGTIGTGVRNRSLFLELREEIKEALDDGWAIKQIHRTLIAKKKMSCSYPAFIRYVNTLILAQKDKATVIKKDQKPAQQPIAQPAKHDGQQTQQQKPKGFFINSSPKLEDLV